MIVQGIYDFPCVRKKYSGHMLLKIPLEIYIFILAEAIWPNQGDALQNTSFPPSIKLLLVNKAFIANPVQ